MESELTHVRARRDRNPDSVLAVRCLHVNRPSGGVLSGPSARALRAAGLSIQLAACTVAGPQKDRHRHKYPQSLFTCGPLSCGRGARTPRTRGGPSALARGRCAYMARMLFSGRSGISRTLVLDRTASWLVVDTVLPVMRWTW